MATYFLFLGFGFVAGSEKPVVIRSVIPSKAWSLIRKKVLAFYYSWVFRSLALFKKSGRFCGITISAPYSGLSGPGLIPAWNHVCYVLGYTHTVFTVPFSTKVGGKGFIRAKWLIRAKGSPSFLSMKRLRVFLLPAGWDASPSQGYPQK